MMMELMASLTTSRRSPNQLVVAAVVFNANEQIRRTLTRLELRARRISDIRIMADVAEEVVVVVAVAVVATSIAEDTVKTEKEMEDISLTVEEVEEATTVVVNIVGETIEATTTTEAIADGETIIDQQVTHLLTHNAMPRTVSLKSDSSCDSVGRARHIVRRTN